MSDHLLRRPLAGRGWNRGVGIGHPGQARIRRINGFAKAIARAHYANSYDERSHSRI